MTKKNRKIAVVLGTRPEIIKLSPVIRRLRALRKDYFVVHTGQHYSYEMDRLFFKELGLPVAKYRLLVHQSPASGHGQHVGRMLDGLEDILLKERPWVVLVQGDTNTVMAAALVASKIQGMKVGHVEAGLRSYDRAMPEEVNRVITDHISDFLWPPTVEARRTLLKEGIAPEKIFVTGNTIVDAVRQNLALARQRSKSLPYGLSSGGFFLLTLHRQENVDDPARLKLILLGLKKIHEHFQLPIIFPAHPRTVKMLKHFGLKLPAGVREVPPAGFLDFLRLEAEARLILTDSGGVQEEACILRVPCVTLRTTTERPETVTAGGNVIAGFRPKNILLSAESLLRIKKKWKNPFGDGHSAEKILRTLERMR